MAHNYQSTVSDFVTQLFVNGGFTPYWIGPIETILRNDSEDNAYRDVTNEGRIDVYNLIPEYSETKQICGVAEQTWTMTINKYAEARANENKWLEVAGELAAVVDYIESSLGATFGGVFESFDYGTAEVTIDSIANTRVYIGSITITGEITRTI